MSAEKELESASFVLSRPTVNLYKSISGGREPVSLQESIYLNKQTSPDGGTSAQHSARGLKSHPFDFDVLKLLKDYNEHHATCISAKVSATVGLGFLNEHEKKKRQNPEMGMAVEPGGVVPESMPLYQPSKVDDVLDPLCRISWHDVLMDVDEDYEDTGNGYIEVIRSAGKITGLHHLPSRETYMKVEDSKHNYHYVIKGGGSERHFAAFGDKEAFIERAKANNLVTFSDPAEGETLEDTISEVIHFRKPSSRDKNYGTPDWVSAVPMIELAQMLHQYKFDFFNNRGVPEFLLFITGKKVGDKEWKVIEDTMKANIGHGNSHKSAAINIPMPEVEIHVEKLAIEGVGDDKFKELKETIALSIVTAHKVPPLLAGIQIPGKLGATNELSQALIAFQSLVVGQAQRLFHMTLSRTLAKDPSIALSAEDFVFKTITDDLDPAKMDTIGRMHQPLPQANAEGRDVDNGVRD